MVSSLQVSPPKPLYPPLLSPIRATCLVHLILLGIITWKKLGEQYRSFTFSLCSFLNYPVTSRLLGLNIPLSTLFSKTLSLRSSHNVSDQVSHPYKTTGKIIILYILSPSRLYEHKNKNFSSPGPVKRSTWNSILGKNVLCVCVCVCVLLIQTKIKLAKWVQSTKVRW